MEDISFNDLLNLYQRDNTEKTDICFFSMVLGSDCPFYDKKCVEDGNFAWADYKLNHTVFINPIELYEEDIINHQLFNFVDDYNGEDLKEELVKE
jgi:hypothetical protein